MYNFLPQTSYPLVNGVGTYVQSPICTNFTPSPNPYEDYVNATSPAPPNATYYTGWKLGYSLLTSGLQCDIPMALAMKQVYQARITKYGNADYGSGCMDVWRLLVEDGLNLAKVIASI